VRGAGSASCAPGGSFLRHSALLVADAMHTRKTCCTPCMLPTCSWHHHTTHTSWRLCGRS
jgi:hypothetical protein